MANLIVFLGTGVLLFTLLFSNYLLDGIFGSSLQRLAMAVLRMCQDPDLQDFITVSLGLYLFIFVLLEQKTCSSRRSIIKGSSNLLLLFFAARAILHFTTHPFPFEFSAMIVLLVSLVMGKLASFVIYWGKGYEEVRRRSIIVQYLCIFVVSCGILCHRSNDLVYSYHGQARWAGVWVNPNICGMLSAVALILLAGLAIRCCNLESALGLFRRATRKKQRGELEICRYVLVGRRVIWHIIWIAMLLVAAYGLLNSYCRGAWVAIGVSVLVLIVGAFSFPIYSEAQLLVLQYRLRKGMLYTSLFVTITAASVFIISSHYVPENRLLSRIFSVVNTKDFSWKNRIEAWNGMFEMIADKPMLGFGWNRLTSIYTSYYESAEFTDGKAIQSNDFLLLGAAFGIPALFSLGTYMYGALAHKECGSVSTTGFWEGLSCRAGATVLVVGFWFDGGLFSLPTAAVFWILSEIGRAGTSCVH